MNESKQFCGIDISRDVFDAYQNLEYLWDRLFHFYLRFFCQCCFSYCQSVSRFYLYNFHYFVFTKAYSVIAPIMSEVNDFIGIYTKHCDQSRFNDLKKEIRKIF
jgi:hypothetical protein